MSRKQPQKTAPPRAIWTDWLQDTPLSDPNPSAWDQLTVHIEQNPPQPGEVQLLDAALADWPDALRLAPGDWILAASRRKQAPAHWSLARTVHCEQHGAVNPVKLTPARLKWLLTSPNMGHIRHLILKRYMNDKLLDTLIERLPDSAALSGLQTLRLYSCGVGLCSSAVDLLRHLTQASWFGALNVLDLDQRFFGPHISRDLPIPELFLQGKHLSNLEELGLNWLSGEGMLEAVLTAPHLSNVHTLRLGAKSVNPDQILRMVHDPRRWRALDLWGPSLTADSAVALANAPNLDALTVLSLSAPIGMKGVLALLESEKLPRLTELNLQYTDITEADAEQLRSHPRAARFDRLWCTSKRIKSPVHLKK